MPKILTMLLVFAVLLLGHALAFYLAFAIDVYQFRDVWASLVSLLRACMGDFELDTLTELQPALAIFFGSAPAVFTSARRAVSARQAVCPRAVPCPTCRAVST